MEEIEKQSQKEHEGGLFVYVYSSIVGDKIRTTKLYHTVKQGIVYEIRNSKLVPTGDTVFRLSCDCMKIGKYNPKFKYPRKTTICSYKEFCKRNKII